ncbi:MAG: type III pantothenate kinase [Bacteroidetes bacterium]|nr:type III pantothenate kinase [Bacteroidota bacterium]
MQLCIDIGNTAIKYALFSKRKLTHKSVSDTFDEAVLLKLVLAYQPDTAMVSSVRPIPKSWLRVLEKATKTTVLTHKTSLPIRLDYRTPETLGRDRIAVAVAGFSKYPQQNTLIINAGTCITFDIINDKGVYKGGAISPGIEMRYKAMNKLTAKLPYVTNRTPVRITGKSTEESMNAGVLNHLCYEIEGAIQFYSSHFNQLNVILTGGDSSFLAKRLKNSIFAAPNLVLTGLNEILIYNA